VAVPYDTPGRVDQLPDALLDRWNQTIQENYDALAGQFGSRFFSIDPALPDATPAQVDWFADPAEPAVCVTEEVAQQLCDWGPRGRHGVQDEYCEFATIRQTDSSGQLRAKRVELTTELAEYWTCLAMADPEQTRSLASSVLGIEVSPSDLYGGDPDSMDEGARRIAFARQMAGHGNHADLEKAKVRADPVGRLNQDRALFMSHAINGLDDLIYIVLFGAKPYAGKEDDGTRRQASRDEIFRQYDVEYLACRHADPTAAMAACGAAFAGLKVAFADPLGMYIQAFQRDALLYEGNPVPDDWVQLSRGSEGMYQRLVVGPPDDHDAYLDDIAVASGAAERPLTGGYQLLKLTSVGPLVVAAKTDPVAEDEYVDLPAVDPIGCHEADFCQAISRLKEAYDAAHGAIASPRQHALR
jgi:hypothetical protein